MSDEETVTEAVVTSSRRHHKFKMCGTCTGCSVSENCGVCSPCMHPSSKKKCRQRVCVSPVTNGEASTNNPVSTFARVLRSVTAEEQPHLTTWQVEKLVEEQWLLWVSSQAALTANTQKEGAEQAEEVTVQTPKELSDFGFARTPCKTFFPAVKVSGSKRVARVQVLFMVTGESPFIPVKDWLPYSLEEEQKLLVDPVSNRGGFGAALAELREGMARVGQQAETMSGEAVAHRHSSTVVAAPRKLGPVSARIMVADKAFNEAAFKAKIIQGSQGMWECRNCPTFKATSRMRAMRHARTCGERPSMPRARSQVARHHCSAASCDMKFVSLGELHGHYWTCHPDHIRPVKCTLCRTTFASMWHLKRHNMEQHSAASQQPKLYRCDLCDFSTTRKPYLDKEHMMRNHWKEFNLLEVGMEEEGGEDMEDLMKDDEAEDGSEDDLPESGLVRTIQVQIREMRSRESLVPVEVRRLANLQEMLKMAREAALDEAKQEVEKGAVARGQARKRKAEMPAAGPVRHSARLMPEREAAVEVATSQEVEDEFVGSQQEGMRELEVAGEPEEEASRAVGDLLGAMLDQVVSKWPLGKRCAVCGVVKRCAGNLASHVAAMHAVADPPIACQKVFCSLSFSTLWELEEHRAHCKFTCAGCNWSTTRGDRVLGHMRRCGGK